MAPYNSFGSAAALPVEISTFSNLSIASAIHRLEKVEIVIIIY